MDRAFSLSPLLQPNPITPPRLIVKISATRNVGMSGRSLVVKPPALLTYDLKGIIQFALSEDAGDLDVTCKATIPAEMEVEAHFLAKEDGHLQKWYLRRLILPEG